jgi:hypothetical protein
MDIVWSLGLIVVALLALNHMTGGSPSNVLRPTTGIVTRLFSMVLRIVGRIFGTAFRLGVGSVKLPTFDEKRDDSDRGPGPPPPRWD